MPGIHLVPCLAVDESLMDGVDVEQSISVTAKGPGTLHRFADPWRELHGVPTAVLDTFVDDDSGIDCDF